MSKLHIAFATAQGITGSTNVGRILPLVTELKKQGHTCSVLLLHKRSDSEPHEADLRSVGSEPFLRTETGKQRLRGVGLAANMLATALRTTWVLRRIKPNVVVISKPLPSNTLGVWLYYLLTSNHTILLDADDFELTSNKLSSIADRAVIHWSERCASRIADKIIVASPFLSDHFQQLTQNGKPIEVIPTGIVSAGPTFAQATTEPSKSASTTPQLPTLTYLGSISVSSGHRVDLLPDILQKIKSQNESLHLLMAGDGDDVATLKSEFNKRNLSAAITWHGRFTLAQVPTLLAASTIMIDPVDDSIANRAKSSSRVLVAATFGLPVVTSDIGIRGLLLPAKFHDRFFADPADIASYALKINELLLHPLTPTERRELQQHAGRYTWDKLAHQYYDILIKK